MNSHLEIVTFGGLSLRQDGAPLASLIYRKAEALLVAGHTGCVRTLVFSRDDQLLTSGSDDERVTLWNGSDR